MPTKWQRVTDPELATELFANGLLYQYGGMAPPDMNFVSRYPEPAWGWDGNEFGGILGLTHWSFYVRLEE